MNTNTKLYNAIMEAIAIQVKQAINDYYNSQSIQENWFHDLVGSGKPLYSVLLTFIRESLKKIVENNSMYEIQPNNVQYDRNKGVIFYKNHEECKWSPIYELKNGVIIENIKDNKMCGNDKECQKAIETFLTSNKIGREIKYQLKNDGDAAERNKQYQEKLKNDPTYVFKDYCDDHGGFENMKKGLGSAKYYYSIHYKNKTYYFANRNAAEKFAKLAGENTNIIHTTEV